MASLQDTLARATSQLRDLSVSQKLAIFLGVLLIGGSTLWLVQWAATPQMTPLLDQPLTPEEEGRLIGALQQMGEKFEISNGRVLVRQQADRDALLASLQQSGAMPSDVSVSFERLVENPNPWISRDESERQWTIALQNRLEAILRAYAGVKDASVVLNINAARTGFSRNPPRSSASVTLHMNGGAPVSRTLALTAAQQVAGAVRGLRPQDVAVLDGQGRVALDWDGEESDSLGALQRQQRELENAIAGKIRAQIADPQARVNVQVELEHTAVTMLSDEPTAAVDQRESRSSTETHRGTPANQPGVQPNVGVSVSGRSIEESTTEETSETEKVVGRTQKHEKTPPGTVRSVFAAVNISHSYLEAIFRKKNPAAADPPTDEQITAIFNDERQRIIDQATMLVKPQSADQVRVSWFYDAADVALGPAAADGPAFSVPGLAREFGPSAAIGLLALTSFGLLLRMARKAESGESFGLELGLPREAIEAAKKAADDIKEHGAVATQAAAEASAAARETPITLDPASILPTITDETVLEGQEVDEEVVQINNMVRQIADVVSGDPDSVATLIEKWVTSSAPK